MEVRLFEPEDLLRLQPQQAQLQDIPEAQRLEYGWQFKEQGSAFTLWDDTADGMRPIFCGGALHRHAEYAALWGLFSIHKPKVPSFLTRTVRHFVSTLRHARVDTQVSADNPGALGWARLIGLEEEARLHGAMPNGADMVIMVKKGML